MNETATIIATIPKNTREDVVIALDEYRGIKLVDVRVHATRQGQDDGDGAKVPTKKGIAIRVGKIPELREALQEAEAEAQRRGLLP